MHLKLSTASIRQELTNIDLIIGRLTPSANPTCI